MSDKCDIFRWASCPRPATVTVEMKIGSKRQGRQEIRACAECAENAVKARPRLYRIAE